MNNTIQNSCKRRISSRTPSQNIWWFI